jgi:hypothetical protein
MTTYNSDLFNPPAPMAEVILRNPDAGMAWTNVPIFLDGPNLKWGEYRNKP